MTVIYHPGGEAPDGPCMLQTGGGVAEVAVESGAFGVAIAAMARAAEDSVATADPDGALAALATRSAMDVAGSLLMDAALQFDGLRRRLKSADLEAVGDAIKVAKDLRAGATLMIEERNRLDKLRKDVAGGVGSAGALDLVAARDEIGRRLARLRHAGGG